MSVEGSVQKIGRREKVAQRVFAEFQKGFDPSGVLAMMKEGELSFDDGFDQAILCFDPGLYCVGAAMVLVKCVDALIDGWRVGRGVETGSIEEEVPDLKVSTKKGFGGCVCDRQCSVIGGVAVWIDGVHDGAAGCCRFGEAGPGRYCDLWPHIR